METPQSSQSRKFTPKTDNKNLTSNTMAEEPEIQDPNQAKIFPEEENIPKRETENAKKIPATRGDESKIIESIPIEDTPFHSVKVEDKWFLTLGKYRLSPTFGTHEEVLEDAKDASWMRIMQIIQLMIDEDKNKTKTK